MILIFFSSLLTNYLLHFSISAQIFETLQWPLLNIKAFLVSWALIFLPMIFLSLVFNSLRRSLLITQVFFLSLALISYFKIQKLGFPLTPWDFFAVKDFVDVLTLIIKKSPVIILSLCLLILGIVGFIRYFPNKVFLEISLKRRLSSALFVFIFFACLVLAHNPLHRSIFDFKYDFKKDQMTKSYLENGLLYNFVLLSEQGQLYPPSSYTESAAKEILKKYELLPQAAPALLPDIVVVMSESLFDPFILKGIKWKQDPLLYTRSLTHGQKLSRAVVPTFGTKTANSEFEFLTSHSIRFLSNEAVPYENIIDGPHQSFIKTLKSVGYSATAIHPGLLNAWNRSHIYPYLGFDKFLSHDDFSNPKNVGNYISDDSILPLLKQSLDLSSSRPSFHFVVTIQNHMPYNPNPFELKDLLFEPEGLNLDEQVVLNYYSKLIQLSDQFHKDLISYLESRKKPTLLVIYGDHLPPLMENFGLYLNRVFKSKNPSHWSEEEKQNMYTTPLVIWSNFNFPDEKEPLEVSLLSSRILNQLHMPLNSYQNFVAQLSDSIRIINRNIRLPSDPLVKAKLKEYRILQYGILSGALLKDNSEKRLSSVNQ